MRGWSARAVMGALAATVTALSVTACGPAGGDTAGSADTSVRIYGTDGNMANSFGDAFKDEPGRLSGMRGTLPLTPLTEDFKRRVSTMAPNLPDYNYAGETYDAVVVAALAAQAAHSVEGPAIAKQIVGVTTGDTDCDTPADCLAAVKQGRHVRYRGITLQRSGLTQSGEPSTAVYGVVAFGRDNRIEDTKTEFVSAGDEKGENKTAPPAPSSNKARTTAPLKLGILLPKTGGLAFQGPDMFAAAHLAVKEVNEAGGVLGLPIESQDGDDGTSPDVAGATLDRFINDGVQVIVGAAASGVSKAILPKAIAAGRVMISPSATSAELSTVDDKGFFFRTSPPDGLQAKALNDIIMRDGRSKIAILARDDSYGKGLAHDVSANLIASGVKKEDVKVTMYKAKDSYDAKADTDGIFTPIAKDVKAFGADGVLIVGFDESAFAIKALATAGYKIGDTSP